MALSPRLLRTVTIVFGLAGLLLLVLGGSEATSTVRFMARADRVEGTVITAGPGGNHPLIRFKAPSGDVIDFSQASSGTYKPDDTVTIVFLGNDPAGTARVDRPAPLWFRSAGKFVLGIGLLVIAWRTRRLAAIADPTGR